MMNLYYLLFVVVCFKISGLTAPGTKPDDSVDLNSILSHVNQLETGLHSTMTALQTTMDDLRSTKTELQATQSELQALKRKQNEDVAFQVIQKGTSSAGWTTLKFDTVDCNTGVGYNSSSGVFTAPVLGTYNFWINVMFSSPGGHEVYIYKGQKRLISGYDAKGDHDMFGIASTMIVTRLDRGDQVYFTTHSTSNIIYGSDYSSYGGALLHAT